MINNVEFNRFKSKIMELETIITKDKEQFLQKEKPWFHWRSFKAFRKFMEEDAVECKNCGTWYWEGCNKRCDCI